MSFFRPAVSAGPENRLRSETPRAGSRFFSRQDGSEWQLSFCGQRFGLHYKLSHQCEKYCNRQNRDQPQGL